MAGKKTTNKVVFLEEKRMETGIWKYENEHGQRRYRVDGGYLKCTDGRKKRFIKQGLRTYHDAREALALAKAASTTGSLYSPVAEKILFSAAWKLYEPFSKQENAKSTYTRNLSLKTHLMKHLGNTRMCRITDDELKRYRNTRTQEKDCRGNYPTESTINREVSLYRRIHRFMVFDMKRLPASSIPQVKLKNEKKYIRKTVINEEQFQRLLENAATPLKPILIMAFDLGMRKSEILLLKEDRCVLKNNLIFLKAEDTKTNDARKIPLTPRARGVLEEALRNPDREDKYVFVNPKTGTYWRNIRKMWVPARKLAGLTADTGFECDFRFHDLRHSFTTCARKRGISETVIMSITGHKTRAMFDRYDTVDDEDRQNAADKMAAKPEIPMGELDRIARQVLENPDAAQA
ncbi:MAG: site-specific integrase [Proteobacteria bacterium]|nr:site-specific integrase [Pseudomonadota bacterium]